MDKKLILDVCCGSKMFWFDKTNPNVVFNDVRKEDHILCDGRTLSVNPDTMYDFTDLPFENESFKLVVFDPPPLVSLGNKSWMAKKYGVLTDDWRIAIRAGFNECFRVLEDKGVLVFKWNEIQIKTSEILKLCDIDPLFGYISGKRSNTHWIVFMKGL